MQSVARRAFVKRAAWFLSILVGGNIYFTFSRNKFDMPKLLALSIAESDIVPPPVNRKLFDTRTSVYELETKICSFFQLSELKSSDFILVSKLRENLNLKLVSAIENDYSAGQIVVVDGWYMSNTEYLVFSYLSRFS